MKTVQYIKANQQGYGWVGVNSESCIMSEFKEERVNLDELRDYVNNGIISEAEYTAIITFDAKRGTAKELKVLKKLGKRLEVKMIELKENI